MKKRHAFSEVVSYQRVKDFKRSKAFQVMFWRLLRVFPRITNVGKKVNVYQAAVPKEQLYAANINDELSAAWLKRAADPGQTKIETGDFLNFPSVWGMGITIL